MASHAVASTTQCALTAPTTPAAHRATLARLCAKPRPAAALTRSFKTNKHTTARRALSVRADDEDPPPSAMVIVPFQQALNGLLAKRIIRLGGEVNDDICNSIVAQLLYLDQKDPEEDITLYINSPGGSVTAGMAVFDTMRHIRPDVKTVCVGMAASMGAFLLSAGTKGKRYTLPNSRIMIHQPLGGARGQAADIELQAMEMMHHKNYLNKYLAEFCGKTDAEMKRDTDRDFFLGAHEAVAYGVVDHVIENERWNEVQKLPMQMYDFAKYDWRELPTLDPENPENIKLAKREADERRAKKEADKAKALK
mmetsp:Transcript_36952/g.62226  ORF Transcript_36952/g.62226 Transcript_36952/m.62226 type:complete len:309 (+) Transcript_36952:81-1007(+)|eukprot:CAMPEP_0198208094 /NCGR_PEP_ID=MMETSP1445-20131203/11485_1 /TAXON_ID=36898 /ORGANISM="Pyramimonas sp., Strain CCMP2087" /LENGTH=308 /DNA_ID=CAMNT_0043881361 /DNA_START=76 /DNA_END=1002 /DNA_ORIENTATION=+